MDYAGERVRPFVSQVALYVLDVHGPQVKEPDVVGGYAPRV
jgi:hypothetical protein